LYCLDAASGEKLFTCQVPGLGRGIGMLATAGQSALPVAAAEPERQSAEDATVVVAAAATA
jgi:hypothetical protein